MQIGAGVCDILRRISPAPHGNFPLVLVANYFMQPLYMRICNGVDENFQPHFVISIAYCITYACITNSTSNTL